MTQKLIDEIKKEILGSDYELSFLFVTKEKIKELNFRYRGKDKPTDVLSFPLSKKSGEILISKEIAKVKCKEFGMTEKKYLNFLLIHAMLHLKGFDHGDKMERAEKKYIQKFDL